VRATEYPTVEGLLAAVRQCRACEKELPLGPRPVLSVAESVRILAVGQARGARMHASGISWDDASGARLRDWMGVALRVSPSGYYAARSRSRQRTGSATIVLGVFRRAIRLYASRSDGSSTPPSRRSPLPLMSDDVLHLGSLCRYTYDRPKITLTVFIQVRKDNREPVQTYPTAPPRRSSSGHGGCC